MAEPMTTPVGLYPHLTVKGGAAAMEFYKKAFGAEELSRVLADDGKRFMHAALRVNGATVFLNDDFPEYQGGKESPTPAGFNLHLQVDDVDRWFARAVTAGATAVMKPEDMFWGDRYGQVKDPFGHVWAFGSPIKK
jgi:PhnB protein